MNKKLICLLVIFCMLLSVQNVVGPATTSAGSSGGSGGGGGGGSKQVDIDRLIKAVEDGKKSKPEKFEELKTLLWKDPITSENYTLPTVLLYYGGNNTTVSRTELFSALAGQENCHHRPGKAKSPPGFFIGLRRQ